jgi:hypothetical protein
MIQSKEPGYHLQILSARHSRFNGCILTCKPDDLTHKMWPLSGIDACNV